MHRLSSRPQALPRDWQIRRHEEAGRPQDLPVPSRVVRSVGGGMQESGRDRQIEASLPPQSGLSAQEKGFGGVHQMQQ